MVTLTIVDPNNHGKVAYPRVGVRDRLSRRVLPISERPLKRERSGPPIKCHGEIHRDTDIHGVPRLDRYASHRGRRTPKPRCLARARTRGATRREVGATAGKVVVVYHPSVDGIIREKRLGCVSGGRGRIELGPVPPYILPSVRVGSLHRRAIAAGETHIVSANRRRAAIEEHVPIRLVRYAIEVENLPGGALVTFAEMLIQWSLFHSQV